ncbi:MAG: response regulator [Pseudomonadota bacterium]
MKSSDRTIEAAAPQLRPLRSLPRKEPESARRPSAPSIVVLLVEDSLGDARLTQEAFSESARPIRLHVVRDGVEAIAFLHRQPPFTDAPRPDLILLDLDLPKLSGGEVLALVKSEDCLNLIPTIVLSTSDAQTDILNCYRLQASCYLTKPLRLSAFESVVNSLGEFWLTHASLPPRPAHQ